MSKHTTKTPDSRVLALRKGLGLTRAQFSHLLGASERSVASWEKGVAPGQSHARLLKQLERIYSTASRVMKREFIPAWLHAPLEALEKLTPAEAIQRGEHDRVWRLLFAVESGAHA